MRTVARLSKLLFPATAILALVISDRPANALGVEVAALGAPQGLRIGGLGIARRGARRLARRPNLDSKITVHPDVPADIPGGATKASLRDAARFAWREFIALNWPAAEDVRDTPDTALPFGDPDFSGPLVWHTFRHKVEIYPGQGNPPGFVADPGLDFGYDARPPQYVYGTDIGDGTGIVPPCPNQEPVASPSFINLDEISQIGLDSMFAGIAPTDVPNNSEPQLIRFLAKSNRKQYTYVVDPNALEPGGDPLFSHPSDCDSDPTNTYCEAIDNFVAVADSNGEVTTLPGFVIDLPDGTIELKSAWRELTDEERESGRFYVTTVRYYIENDDDAGTACYVEAEWGLVALHIEQKTPTAPYFIYATFEQADNILLPNGAPVEDEDGNIISPPDAASSTFPELVYTDGNPPTLDIVGDDYCEDPGRRLYYQEESDEGALPSGGNICQNFRDNPIPRTIVEVNAEAHDAIEAYRRQRGLGTSVWQFYKLINVQHRPFDVTEINQDPASDNNPATFYLANSVVETDNTLQLFSGRLYGGVDGDDTSLKGTKSDLPPNFDNFNGRSTYQNTLTFDGDTLKNTYNMGGCMGCHANAQLAGTDFSFILNDGRNDEPEAPDVTLPGVSNSPFDNIRALAGH